MKLNVACIRVFGAMLSLAVAGCSAGEDSKGTFEAGLTFTDDASAADVGLPAYPGSKPYKENEDSSAAANIALSTSLFGFKVVAMNLETSDKQDKVAAFYRKALSKYGHVLECSDAAAGRTNTESSAAPNGGLTCDPNDSGSHSVVYKVGTEDNQRIVAIKPHGSGTRFNIVQLDMRDESEQ